MSRELTRSQLVERSIIKKYHKVLWTPFMAAIRDYALLRPDDRIAVCVSGGRDSMLLAKLMQQLHRHSDVPFQLEFICLAPDSSVEENAALLQIPLRVADTPMSESALFALAQTLGCNKIALGHHRNDVIETTVTAMFYHGQLRSMNPKRRSEDFPGLELIRPMYNIREADVAAWAHYNDLRFPQPSLPEERRAVRQLLQTQGKHNPGIETSIFRSLHAVNLDMFPEYENPLD